MKKFEDFVIMTMFLILTIYGKLNFLSLARHCKSCESRFRQNFKKKFDWCAFNMRLLRRRRVVSRLRDDAALQYLYTGPQKEGQGCNKRREEMLILW